MREVIIEVRTLVVVVLAVSKGTILAASPVIHFIVFVQGRCEGTPGAYASYFCEFSQRYDWHGSVMGLAVAVS